MGESSWVVQLIQDLDKSIEASRWHQINWRRRSIYKLPKSVTDLNRSAYRPHVVSFGPYHHGAPHLKAMEEHKCRALCNFIDRARGRNMTSGDLIGAVSEVVKDLKDCYDSLDPVWDTDERFVKLMILDGCFMLEILRTATQIVNDYDPDDPIFSNHGRLNIMPFIRRDMLMLENQLPMLVLDTLVAIGNGGHRQGKDYVNRLILKFFSHNETRVPHDCHHVLDVYRKSLLYEGRSRKITRRPRADAIIHSAIIHSAAELDEAGIDFKVSDSISLRDISFTGGELRLPIIVVDDTTESMFLNLIAIERFHVGAGNDVTSYIFIMDSIIDNEKDVALLHSKGIIQNAIGSDKAVSKLFNSLSRDVTPDGDGDLMVVYKRVNNYCRKPWRIWRANLVRTHDTGPKETGPN